MSRILRFGVARQVALDLGPETEVTAWDEKTEQTLADPAAATAGALESPLDLPPIAQALAPGDQIVVALDADTPQAAEVAAGAIRALREAGAESHDIVLVLSHRRAESDSEGSFLAEHLLDDVAVEVHDPADAAALCYLASSEDNHPIYLNRRIVEADFVLPISPVRLASSFGYFGAWAGLFPAFADQATRQRYQSPEALKAASAKRLTKEADEAAWLLGVQFVVQVLPGPDDTLLAVLAGSAEAVQRRGREQCEAVWRRPVQDKASLVVAAISGGPDQQTWENFARALYAASQVVAENGAIAICTQIDRMPGPALRRLAGLDDLAAKHRALERQHSFDAQTALLLADLLEKKRVYLLSELDAETVEDLGLAHMENEDELVRLVRLHRTCIFIADAQYAMPAEA